jgi:hypothetical protein
MQKNECCVCGKGERDGRGTYHLLGLENYGHSLSVLALHKCAGPFSRDGKFFGVWNHRAVDIVRHARKPGSTLRARGRMQFIRFRVGNCRPSVREIDAGYEFCRDKHVVGGNPDSRDPDEHQRLVQNHDRPAFLAPKYCKGFAVHGDLGTNPSLTVCAHDRSGPVPPTPSRFPHASQLERFDQGLFVHAEQHSRTGQPRKAAAR